MRDLRREQGLSSMALADLAGVTPAYISQIERNLAEPSLSVLRKLARTLNVELLFLLEYEVPADVFIAAGEGAAELTFPQAHAKYRLLSPIRLKNGEKPDMSFMLVRIEAGKTDYDEMVTHDFVEFCYVLEGCIEYRTDKRTYRLEEGDSLYMKKNVPHLVYNPGTKEAKVFVVLGNMHPHWQKNEQGGGRITR
ncbi:MAG: helix-turn-helix domain-containing protein [Paenibacillus macerans]|uniref:helix-turn-helix domain-containing protein n=1 Tax=Paenibacillus TaxID=44249 RepID=UPI001D13116C|nr:helix-turn-helix domain-containing protein [Paenibacillus macerans]MDU7473847.1 helix-turn-helix domain-containing protein [Paenibacillus macerans]MEC0138440.1 helix-turn-helix domain-containing protein [Paenibacillus macerans]MEC0154093.1 helix-turn-helix domain-containing protein [Paenibacillus macerans]MEC0332497.1 helix-turn-helix domain-containing protein [Paenibacillus macerans]UMV50800.1 helix-turn-helix domain-containing protein [Paenibacillus macerans]